MDGWLREILDFQGRCTQMIVDGIDGEIVPIRAIGMETNLLTEQTSFSNLARVGLGSWHV